MKVFPRFLPVLHFFGVDPLRRNSVKSKSPLAALIALSLLVAPAFVFAQGQPKDSDDDLRRAIESSGGSETQIIANLEGYLKKYPNSERQRDIFGEICKLSLKLGDRDRAIIYAERLAAGDKDDMEGLTTLIKTLRERKAEGDLTRAVAYAEELVKRFERIISTSPKPARVSSAQWQDRKNRGIASVYLLRGRAHADVGAGDKARADLTKSYQLARTADAAIALGELAEKAGTMDEAIDYYLQAFAISLNTGQEIDLKSLRRKVGLIYSAKNGSEAGLGDHLLKAHDAFVKERDERLARLDPPNINSGIADPLNFTLTRLDGSPLKLNDHRGKVIVINFWATWCGPCITEMPLFEKTMTKYKEDQDVFFLAISTDEDRELVEPFLKRFKFTFPVVHDEYLNDHFGVSSIPTTIILDRKGGVSFRQAGFNPREDFVEALSEKIEDAKKK
jgi:thiol-disulfide isomerase/thioredoxin